MQQTFEDRVTNDSLQHKASYNEIYRIDAFLVTKFSFLPRDAAMLALSWES